MHYTKSHSLHKWNFHLQHSVSARKKNPMSSQRVTSLHATGRSDYTNEVQNWVLSPRRSSVAQRWHQKEKIFLKKVSKMREIEKDSTKEQIIWDVTIGNRKECRGKKIVLIGQYWVKARKKNCYRWKQYYTTKYLNHYLGSKPKVHFI